MALNIKVCLRVRPLSSREAACDERLSLNLDPETNTVQLHNHWKEQDNGISPSRHFNFDYCFWSADRSCPYSATQEKVFQTIGEQVLDALFDGYNTCVLAYGQSGTGKTYTMMGTEAEPGLTPRFCSAIFERASTCSNPSSIRIDVSFMEIYNEKVRDLLDNRLTVSSLRSQRGNQMRIREHPKFGPYVQDLSRHNVQDASGALELLSAGLQRRTSAPTHSNGHSSRSHAIFTIHCTTARMLADGTPRETVAKLHLVDLAGSERANRDPVSRLRLKEGSLINKSLATLGNVINALAERSSGGLTGSGFQLRSSSSSNCSSAASSPRRLPGNSRLPFVPYRDSVLTWILKDSLGGNSRTFFVAAVSPSIDAWKETLSTLRFAQRAKHIVNTPMVNEDASVKLIRHLREEVSRLKAVLAQSVIRPEQLVDLMTANQSKAEELTEDWLQKWEPRSVDFPRSSIDAAVQTVSGEDSMGSSTTDLIPVKEERMSGPMTCQFVYNSPDVLRNHSSSESDEEDENWSDDSLEGCPVAVADSFDEDGNSFRRLSSPHPPLLTKRIHARKTAPKPDVRTIFTASQPTLPPQIVIDPPMENAELATPFPDSKDLMARLNSLISKLSLNNNKVSDLQMDEKNSVSQANVCCPTHHHHCHHCVFHHHHCRHRCCPHHPDVDTIIKNELLAIRRRMVARTASKKVADSLPYLAQWRAGPTLQATGSLENLPGEMWV